MAKLTTFFNLSIPAQKRLAQMRQVNKDWKKARPTTHKNLKSYVGDFSQGFNDGTPIWSTHTGPQFRGERFADECEGGPGHTGWFSDVDQFEKVRGIVGLLPHGRFIAGYYWTSNGERVYYPEVFTDEGDAANAADGYAESYAEVCMEDSEKFNAVRELEEENEISFCRLRECLLLRNKACMQYVRDEISELIEKIRDNREKLQTDFAEFC